VTFLISLVFWYTPPECFSELPQDRHPERSASRIYCVTEGLQRVVEEPRGCLLADALHGFPATKTMREIKKSQPPSEALHRFIAWYSAWWRGVEGTPKVLILSMLFGAFRRFCGRLKKNTPKKTTPNRLTLVGLRPGLGSAVPRDSLLCPTRHEISLAFHAQAIAVSMRPGRATRSALPSIRLLASCGESRCG
jgi:hypothetical protein